VRRLALALLAALLACAAQAQRVKVLRSLPDARSTACTPAEVPTHRTFRAGSTVSART